MNMQYFSIYLCCSSVSFISVLQFSVYKSFTSMDKFILRDFVLFGAIVNQIVFFISLLVSLLLVYRKATDFYILVLHPLTILNSFISSNGLWWSLQAFLHIVSCHLQIMTISLLPFQSGCHLFLSSCLITVARTSNIILTRSGKSGHPFLLSDFKTFQLFIVKYYVSYVFFLYCFYYIEV